MTVLFYVHKSDLDHLNVLNNESKKDSWKNNDTNELYKLECYSTLGSIEENYQPSYRLCSLDYSDFKAIEEFIIFQ